MVGHLQQQSIACGEKGRAAPMESIAASDSATMVFRSPGRPVKS